MSITGVHQKGAGLVEVLATLFILSIGLLGIAGLQAKGIQAGQGASLRTSAILVAEDIASRMKANRVGVYDTNVGTGYYQAGIADTGTDNGCNDTSAAVAVSCTPSQMAAHDIYLWKQNLANVLPNGTGQISWSVNNQTASATLVSVTLTITWTEKGDTKSYVSNFEVLSS